MSGFDDLERQLRVRVAATASTRRPHRRLRGSLALLGVLLVGGGAVTASATGVLGGPDARREVDDLLSDVYRVTRDVEGCRPTTSRSTPRVSDLAASDEARSAFPRLRDAPTAAERALARTERFALAKRFVVLSGGARELRATDGTRYALIVLAAAGRALGPDARCVDRQRRELRRLSRYYDEPATSRAREALEASWQSQRADRMREQLELYELHDGSLGGGGTTFTAQAIRRGMASIELRRIHGERRFVVAGLTPARVASVVVSPRRGPARPLRRVVPDGVFHLVLPRSFVRPARITWLDGEGRETGGLSVRF